MDLELVDKVAVVTGASNGIGLAIVERSAQEGARVVAGARAVDALAGIDLGHRWWVDPEHVSLPGGDR